MDRITELLLSYPGLSQEDRRRCELVAASQKAEEEGHPWEAGNALRKLSLDGTEGEGCKK
jgi:hypothetical protein